MNKSQFISFPIKGCILFSFFYNYKQQCQYLLVRVEECIWGMHLEGEVLG